MHTPDIEAYLKLPENTPDITTPGSPGISLNSFKVNRGRSCNEVKGAGIFIMKKPSKLVILILCTPI